MSNTVIPNEIPKIHEPGPSSDGQDRNSGNGQSKKVIDL
jgi:hypothetical protein